MTNEVREQFLEFILDAEITDGHYWSNERYSNRTEGRPSMTWKELVILDAIICYMEMCYNSNEGACPAVGIRAWMDGTMSLRTVTAVMGSLGKKEIITSDGEHLKIN